MVVVDEVVVVVEVVESEAEERAVGDGGGPWAAGAGVGCWVLRVVRTRVLKRYPEPVAHGPEARKPMARRPGSRHTRTDAVNTVRQRDIPFL